MCVWWFAGGLFLFVKAIWFDCVTGSCVVLTRVVVLFDFVMFLFSLLQDGLFVVCFVVWYFGGLWSGN